MQTGQRLSGQIPEQVHVLGQVLSEGALKISRQFRSRRKCRERSQRDIPEEVEDVSREDALHGLERIRRKHPMSQWGEIWLVPTDVAAMTEER